MRNYSHSLWNRRHSDRLVGQFSLLYRCPKSGIFKRAQTLDISMGGARFEVAEALAPGTDISLSLQPEPLKILSLQGTVAWCRPSRREGVVEVGVSFRGGCQADLNWLTRAFSLALAS